MSEYKRRSKDEILEQYGNQINFAESVDMLEVLIDIRDELTKKNTESK